MGPNTAVTRPHKARQAADLVPYSQIQPNFKELLMSRLDCASGFRAAASSVQQNYFLVQDTPSGCARSHVLIECDIEVQQKQSLNITYYVVHLSKISLLQKSEGTALTVGDT